VLPGVTHIRNISVGAYTAMDVFLSCANATSLPPPPPPPPSPAPTAGARTPRKSPPPRLVAMSISGGAARSGDGRGSPDTSTSTTSQAARRRAAAAGVDADNIIAAVDSTPALTLMSAASRSRSAASSRRSAASRVDDAALDYPLSCAAVARSGEELRQALELVDGEPVSPRLSYDQTEFRLFLQGRVALEEPAAAVQEPAAAVAAGANGTLQRQSIPVRRAVRLMGELGCLLLRWRRREPG
jgi:hypothetical protein